MTTLLWNFVEFCVLFFFCELASLLSFSSSFLYFCSIYLLRDSDMDSSMLYQRLLHPFANLRCDVYN